MMAYFVADASERDEVLTDAHDEGLRAICVRKDTMEEDLRAIHRGEVDVAVFSIYLCTGFRLPDDAQIKFSERARGHSFRAHRLQAQARVHRAGQA